MSISYLNFNGSILPADQLIFGSNNRAFRYGDGLFESMRLNILQKTQRFEDVARDRQTTKP